MMCLYVFKYPIMWLFIILKLQVITVHLKIVIKYLFLKT